MDAFFLLTNSRQIGMSLGTIPLSEMIAYGSAFGVIEDLRTFCQVLSAMDNTYLQHANKNNKG